MAVAIVFFDRDGTLNVDHGYVTDRERLELIEGAAEAVACCRQAGFLVVIVTNQSAVGRGMATIADVEGTNQALRSMLVAENPEAVVDLVLYCPHAPSSECECRKPQTGMITAPGALPEFDAGRSWVVGDKVSDMEFGRNAGIPLAHCLLIADDAVLGNFGGIKVPDVLAAVRRIISSC